ncbi:unnamed protein product [Rotaria socialis]
MAHAATGVSLDPCQNRIQWMWRSNTDPWVSKQTIQWTSYSDVETAIIEQARQRKAPEALLDNYHINFQHLVQISNNNCRKQRPVKRVVYGRENAPLRTDRFMPNPTSPSRSFVGWGDIQNDFLNAVTSHFKIRYQLRNAAARRLWVEKAAEGLIVEGKIIGKQKEAEWMAEQLLQVKEATGKEIWEVCARLYTMESFLYKKMNEIMRLSGEKKHTHLLQSKVPTFGPFALLLRGLTQHANKKITVYRGSELTRDIIEQYTYLGGDRFFPAFTSTSRSRIKAAEFGNVLFEIQIAEVVDVSQCSAYPDEEEVLLPPHFMFNVQSCTFDDIRGKWIIRLRSCNVRLC